MYFGYNFIPKGIFTILGFAFYQTWHFTQGEEKLLEYKLPSKNTCNIEIIINSVSMMVTTNTRLTRSISYIEIGMQFWLTVISILFYKVYSWLNIYCLVTTIYFIVLDTTDKGKRCVKHNDRLFDFRLKKTFY